MRQKECKYRWVSRWIGTGGSGARKNYNQDILCEKKTILIKVKNKLMKVEIFIKKRRDQSH